MKVLKRIWWIVLIPIFFLNIVIATICILPYWILTGEISYDSKIFNDFKNYHQNLYDTTRNTRT
jgi:hypothetical protein